MYMFLNYTIYRIEEGLRKMLGYIIFACLVLIIGLAVMSIITLHSTERQSWNRGKCKCGGDWILTSEECYINTYVCDKCMHAISITTGIDRK